MMCAAVRRPVCGRPSPGHFSPGGSSPALRRGSTMGLLDRLFGRRDRYDDRGSHGYDDRSSGYQSPQAPPSAPRSADEQAIERYRYLLRTAPPEKIEEAHAEAFAQLSPEQRRQVLEQLSAAVPAGGRARARPPPPPPPAGTRGPPRPA